MKEKQDSLALAQEPKPHTPMDLLSTALTNNAAIDVIERLAALQEKAVARDAEQEFNDALNAAQGEIPRVAPDLSNPQTSSRYASYKALDKVLRPIYIRHGFSLSFDETDCPKPDHIRVLCYCSHRGGHTRKYQKDMACDGKGPKGGEVMTKTHAEGAAQSYAMRYLLKGIFNIAVGEDDTDGNIWSQVPERLEWIANCKDTDELMNIFKAAYKECFAANDIEGCKKLVAAKDQRKKDLA